MKMQDYWIDRYARQGERTVGHVSFSEHTFAENSVKATYLLLDQLYEFCSNGRRALDFGCGVGRLTAAMRPMFDEVYGVDVVPWAVKRAAENCPQGKFYTYDGKTLPFTDGFFDAVVSWTVFQHIPPVEIGGVFDEVARVSVVDSVLVVYENVTRADDKAHVWFRGEGFYVNCFKGRGFEVLKQKLVSNFDGTGEDHALMVFRKC